MAIVHVSAYFSLFSSVEHSCKKHEKPKKKLKSCCAKLLKECKKPVVEATDHEKDDCCMILVRL